MKLAVVEDNLQTQQQIRTLLNAVNSHRQPIITTFFDSGEAFLFQFSTQQEVDLILLDIQLGGHPLFISQ